MEIQRDVFGMEFLIMAEAQLETITLAGGCFWCTEAIFQRLKGVIKVESGYSGGKMENPSYERRLFWEFRTC